MTADIYSQYDAAFARVSAFVILKDGEKIATVAIKFPADGAGKLWAYTHFMGFPMTRYGVSGYGYDKRSPAVQGGFAKAECRVDQAYADRPDYREMCAETLAALDAFRAALNSRDGYYWDDNLRAAGYTVLQAV